MYKRIMIVIDEGAVGKSAVAEGISLAKVHSAEVYFFHVLANYVLPISDVMPMSGRDVDEYRKRVEKRAVTLLTDATKRAKNGRSLKRFCVDRFGRGGVHRRCGHQTQMRLGGDRFARSHRTAASALRQRCHARHHHVHQAGAGMQSTRHTHGAGD